MWKLQTYKCFAIKCRWETDLVELTSDVFFLVLIHWVLKVQSINSDNLTISSSPPIAVNQRIMTNVWMHIDLMHVFMILKIFPSDSLFQVVS